MSEKKRMKHHKLEGEKPTKEEYAVAKYLRFGLPVREGKLHGMEVKCFIASTAVDKLLQSNWSASKNKKDPRFTNRASCILYLNILLQKGLFHRADRDRRKKDKDKESGKKKKKEELVRNEGVKQRKIKKEKKSKKDEEANDETEGKDETEKKTEKKEDKKKKRLKLLMSEEQWFEDGDGVCVWIYDPLNAKTFIIGLLMVFGAIGLCMFPLWPEEVRIGVYYLSLTAAGFVGFILFLVVVRLILFCLVWVLTMGRHHFWFLPNLTEDVGFFESFRPLYKHDAVNGKEETDSGKKKKKTKTVEETEGQGASSKKEKSSDKDDSDEFEVIKKEELNAGPEEDEGKEEEDRDEIEDEDEDEEMADDNNDEGDEDLEENDKNEDINDGDSDEKEDNETKKSK